MQIGYGRRLWPVFVPCDLPFEPTQKLRVRILGAGSKTLMGANCHLSGDEYPAMKGGQY